MWRFLFAAVVVVEIVVSFIVRKLRSKNLARVDDAKVVKNIVENVHKPVLKLRVDVVVFSKHIRILRRIRHLWQEPTTAFVEGRLG